MQTVVADFAQNSVQPESCTSKANRSKFWTQLLCKSLYVAISAYIATGSAELETEHQFPRMLPIDFPTTAHGGMLSDGVPSGLSVGTPKRLSLKADGSYGRHKRTEYSAAAVTGLWAEEKALSTEENHALRLDF